MNLPQHSEDGKHLDLDSLPPGYRFDPTDAEIIVYYLRKKVDHQPLPPNKIIEVDLYAYNPDELEARDKPSRNGQWFYFTPRYLKHPKGKRPNRSAGNGYWKATGADKEIKFEGRKVGYRKALVFYQEGSRTNWIMHEFRVAEAAEPPEPPRSDRKLDEVLCRVYRKNDSKERDCKRPRDEYGNDDLSSSSKIPRLELNPNEAYNQLRVGGGMESVQERINDQYNPYINSYEVLQNQQPIIQIPKSANAVFPQDSLQVLPPAGTDDLQVLPPAGTDVSFHGENSPQVLPSAGTDVYFHGQNNNPMQSSMEFAFSYLDYSRDSEFHSNIIDNAAFPPAGTDVSFHDENSLEVLPSAGTDVYFHGQNNNPMQSSMKLPFSYLDYSRDSEFHGDIIDNAALVSGKDLNPDYYHGQYRLGFNYRF